MTTDPISDFLAAMEAQGLTTNEDVVPDGKLHRFHVEGDTKGKDNGWYVLHLDDRPAGKFGSWKTGETHSWMAQVARRMTDAERRVFEREITAKRRAQEEELARVHAENAKRAEEIWSRSVPATDAHPYAARKGIRPINARLYEQAIVIPVRSPDGRLTSLQFIQPDGTKRFLSGGRIENCYTTISNGPPDPKHPVAICEGYATGCSIHQATDWPVVVAFNAGNLEAVSKTIRSKFPRIRIVVCADNDQWTKRPVENPGVHYGRIAAQAVGGSIAIPVFTHASDTNQLTDFNDLAGSQGLPCVAEILESAMTPLQEDPPPEDPGPLDETDPPNQDEPPVEISDSWQFRALGCGTDQFYYYLKASLNQVVAISAGGHTKQNLMHLAPLNFWITEFPTKKGADWDSAANTLMRACESRGIFSPNQIRGRGTWHDDGRVVLHLGDRVLIGSETMKPRNVRSKFVYEEAPKLELDPSDPLPTRDAVELFNLLKLVPWDEKSARLASGWIMCAHVGGALKWRPHIWVTGPKGAGKSYVMSKIIQRALGENMTFIVSESTEAGIRQLLGNDAIPVLFDEAEGEDRRAHERMQRVLALARQASSETGAKIAKGTVGGRALTFQIRSCFALSSIKPTLQQEADKSRFCIFEVDQTKHQDRFPELEEAVARVLTPDYSRRLFARAVKLAAVIRGNASAFAEAVTIITKDRRAGDQHGALLAGNYALHSQKALTVENATTWLDKQSWMPDVKQEVQGMSDEQKCLEHLYATKVRVGGGKEASIGVLIDVAMAGESQHGLAAEVIGQAIGFNEARFILSMHGIKVDEFKRTIDVARQHPELRQVFEDTAYAHDWGTILKRLPGSQNVNPTSFGSRGAQSRAVRISVGP